MKAYIFFSPPLLPRGPFPTTSHSVFLQGLALATLPPCSSNCSHSLPLPFLRHLCVSPMASSIFSVACFHFCLHLQTISQVHFFNRMYSVTAGVCQLPPYALAYKSAQIPPLCLQGALCPSGDWRTQARTPRSGEIVSGRDGEAWGSLGDHTKVLVLLEEQVWRR